MGTMFEQTINALWIRMWDEDGPDTRDRKCLCRPIGLRDSRGHSEHTWARPRTWSLLLIKNYFNKSLHNTHTQKHSLIFIFDFILYVWPLKKDPFSRQTVSIAKGGFLQRQQSAYPNLQKTTNEEIILFIQCFSANWHTQKNLFVVVFTFGYWLD